MATGADCVDARAAWKPGGRRRRGLTPREREMARELAVSAETVRAHVRNSVTKLHARTRLHAVVMALQRGEITAE